MRKVRYIEYSRCETKGKECVDNGSADHQRTVCQNPDGQDTDRVPFMKIFGGTNDVLPAWERDYLAAHVYRRAAGV